MQGKRPIMYSFPNEVLDRVGCGHDVPPFSVIGSMRTDNRMARCLPLPPSRPRAVLLGQTL